MKKPIALLLALVIVLSLCACGGSKTDANEKETVSQEPTKAVVETTTANETESAVVETPPAKEDDGKYTVYEFNGEPVDKLTIEEVVLEPKYFSGGDHYLTWKIKVRNTSGADLPMKETSMRVWYRYLDENEDVLWDSYKSGGYSSTVKDGKAEWIECTGKPASWDNSDVDAIAYVEFYGYATTLAGRPDYEFTEYVTISLRDYFEW